MTFLATLLAKLTAIGLTIWTRFSGTLFDIISEIPDDEVDIAHGAALTFTQAVDAGKSETDSLNAMWAYIAASEKKELSKVTGLLLQAFAASTAQKAGISGT